MFEKLIEILKANLRKIVFTEGNDARILEAASRLNKDGFLTPVLVGNPRRSMLRQLKADLTLRDWIFWIRQHIKGWKRWLTRWSS